MFFEVFSHLWAVNQLLATRGSVENAPSSASLHLVKSITSISHRLKIGKNCSLTALSPLIFRLAENILRQFPLIR